MTAVNETPTEKCPGHLEWSAFGAWYPDTACSTALDWTGSVEPGTPTLCDADDDYRPKDIPCPFCDPEGFTQYQFAEATPLWATDESPVPAGTEIHYHDGKALTWTARHPERGEEAVLMREMGDNDD